MDAATVARHYAAALIEKQLAAVRLEKEYPRRESAWILETFENAPPYLRRFLESDVNRKGVVDEMVRLMEELRK